MNITIDPGLGRYGGTNTWKLSKFLEEELQKRGFTVYNTRPKLTARPSPTQRGRMALNNESEVFLSLHMSDAVKGAQERPGVLAFYSVQGQEHQLLADHIAAAAALAMDIPNLGSRFRITGKGLDYCGAMRTAVAGGLTCAIHLDHGSPYSEEVASFFSSEENICRLAAAEAEAIAGFFSF